MCNEELGHFILKILQEVTGYVIWFVFRAECTYGLMDTSILQWRLDGKDEYLNLSTHTQLNFATILD